MYIFIGFLVAAAWLVFVVQLGRSLDRIERLLMQIHAEQFESNSKTREEMRDIQRMIETIAVQIRERGP